MWLLLGRRFSCAQLLGNWLLLQWVAWKCRVGGVRSRA